jgi:hypothetical protein
MEKAMDRGKPEAFVAERGAQPDIAALRFDGATAGPSGISLWGLCRESAGEARGREPARRGQAGAAARHGYPAQPDRELLPGRLSHHRYRCAPTRQECSGIETEPAFYAVAVRPAMRSRIRRFARERWEWRIPAGHTRWDFDP